MSQFPIGQNFQAQGQLLTASEEFTLINWAGATLPTPVDTLDEVLRIRDSARAASEALGLAPDAAVAALDLQIRRRDVFTVAAPWVTYYE